ncbi:hypothetical protein TOPH_04700 [Tolypocladium ophioglossoides CBS 100239]|uniref:Splicing factor spf30 n=1 Tax=Tolypocladium ophioglossoides (strain CBS 100239) TaxID=1163406 RepID=A0A0L0N909_TOLOC|nr:hypothetical protein TOPH_04700 [Tolypocladium ophioglossoides CBS 100239]
MSTIAGIEVEKKLYKEQFDIVLGQLRDDPGNAELKALQGELSSLIAMLDESIAELQPKKPEQPEKPAAAEPAQPEKWSRDNHPAFKKAAGPEEKEEALVSYQVNDTVLAKWVSGDRAFYPARITSITGSSTAPIYIKDIRPISNKRKADGPPTTAIPTPPAAPTLGLVSSAGATMYPEAKKDSQKDADTAPKPVKIRAKKVLEANKNKWQEFNSKSKIAKTKKKESMFRTPDGIGGRVGFTGSGQAMRKDPARIRPHHPEEKEED